MEFWQNINSLYSPYYVKILFNIILKFKFGACVSLIQVFHQCFYILIYLLSLSTYLVFILISLIILIIFNEELKAWSSR